MKKVIPSCSVCENRYNEQERCPLLLECGHSYCKDCLFKMFSASTDSSLNCPRCRHVSVVGNSVQSLKKNFVVLELIQEEDEDDEEDEEEEEENVNREVRGCGDGLIEVSSHQDLRLVSRIGEGRRSGVEMWSGVVSGRNCRHNVAVKKVVIGDDMDLVWVQGQLESLRRASMWCRNVCAFHGLIKNQGCLNLLMDKCSSSVLTEMQRNGGRPFCRGGNGGGPGGGAGGCGGRGGNGGGAGGYFGGSPGWGGSGGNGGGAGGGAGGYPGGTPGSPGSNNGGQGSSGSYSMPNPNDPRCGNIQIVQVPYGYLISYDCGNCNYQYTIDYNGMTTGYGDVTCS